MPKGRSRTHIPNRIAYWREYRGLTQQQLADIVGVHKSTVSRWEMGFAPLRELRPLVAKALKRREDEIFFG